MNTLFKIIPALILFPFFLYSHTQYTPHYCTDLYDAMISYGLLDNSFCRQINLNDGIADATPPTASPDDALEASLRSFGYPDSDSSVYTGFLILTAFSGGWYPYMEDDVIPGLYISIYINDDAWIDADVKDRFPSGNDILDLFIDSRSPREIHVAGDAEKIIIDNGWEVSPTTWHYQFCMQREGGIPDSVVVGKYDTVEGIWTRGIYRMNNIPGRYSTIMAELSVFPPPYDLSRGLEIIIPLEELIGTDWINYDWINDFSLSRYYLESTLRSRQFAVKIGYRDVDSAGGPVKETRFCTVNDTIDENTVVRKTMWGAFQWTYECATAQELVPIVNKLTRQAGYIEYNRNLPYRGSGYTVLGRLLKNSGELKGYRYNTNTLLKKGPIAPQIIIMP